jgi:hypothetical protein
MRFYFSEQLAEWRDRHFKILGQRKRRIWRMRIKPEGPMTFLLGKRLVVLCVKDNRKDAYVEEKLAQEQARSRGETLKNDGYYDFIRGLRSKQNEATHRGRDQAQWKEDAFQPGPVDLHELLRSRRHAGLKLQTLDKLRPGDSQDSSRARQSCVQRYSEGLGSLGPQWRSSSRPSRPAR